MTGFTDESARRVGEATLWVERNLLPSQRSPGRGRYTGFGEGRCELAKLDGQLAFEGSATASIWRWNGTAFADTGYNVTVYDWLLSSGQTIAAGTKVFIMKRNVWILLGAQCA